MTWFITEGFIQKYRLGLPQNAFPKSVCLSCGICVMFGFKVVIKTTFLKSRCVVVSLPKSYLNVIFIYLGLSVLKKVVESLQPYSTGPLEISELWRGGKKPGLVLMPFSLHLKTACWFPASVLLLQLLWLTL